jgi:hypothetical protein
MKKQHTIYHFTIAVFVWMVVLISMVLTPITFPSILLLSASTIYLLDTHKQLKQWMKV